MVLMHLPCGGVRQSAYQVHSTIQSYFLVNARMAWEYSLMPHSLFRLVRGASQKIATLTALTLLAGFTAAAEPNDYFKIRVEDETTGRGVPLVELRTVNDVHHYTDSAGVVAFLEPGLMNQDVYFHVSSHGYEFKKDRFGFAGARLRTVPGGSVTLKIARINIAERLYRMTGAGIYRDSLLVGDTPPVRQPVLNGRVFGSDSVVNAVYRGRIHWFWGDTHKPSYPLGNFHVPGATSSLPSSGELHPDIGVDLDYFVDKNGYAKPTAKMPGEGPTWISGLTAVPDRVGEERLIAHYVKIEPPIRTYERGLIVFDDARKEFGKRQVIPLDAPLAPTGHPMKRRENGVEYVYYGRPFPSVRTLATAESVRDLTTYEAYTCLKQGSRDDTAEIERDRDGKLIFSWKRDTPPVVGKLRQKLIQQEKLQPEELPDQLTDIDTGKPIKAHENGSVYWNEYRQRWVAIILETWGTSMLGEIWYTEADAPTGPWVHARKIVTHDKYSFYNPKQHPMFDQDGGRIIYFEGTYTAMFSGNEEKTPRYNYNQIMYKLDLADPRLALPAPAAQPSK